jgi:predicted DNA-binding transcriptional regulator YafY
MLLLLSLLQSGRDRPGRVLAERLEVSDRTVRRDVEHLRDLGYRISAIKGPDGGYRLDAGSELPPLLFDDDQAVALAVALQSAAASGVGDGEAALRALATVRQVMPARLRHRVDGAVFTTLEADPTLVPVVRPGGTGRCQRRGPSAGAAAVPLRVGRSTGRRQGVPQAS